MTVRGNMNNNLLPCFQKSISRRKPAAAENKFAEKNVVRKKLREGLLDLYQCAHYFGSNRLLFYDMPTWRGL